MVYGYKNVSRMWNRMEGLMLEIASHIPKHSYNSVKQTKTYTHKIYAQKKFYKKSTVIASGLYSQHMGA